MDWQTYYLMALRERGANSAELLQAVAWSAMKAFENCAATGLMFRSGAAIMTDSGGIFAASRMGAGKLIVPPEVSVVAAMLGTAPAPIRLVALVAGTSQHDADLVLPSADMCELLQLHSRDDTRATRVIVLRTMPQKYAGPNKEIQRAMRHVEPPSSPLSSYALVPLAALLPVPHVDIAGHDGVTDLAAYRKKLGKK